MNIAYFRKSNRSFAETLKVLEEKAKENQFKILGKTDLQNDLGKLIHLCQENWISNLITSDKKLFGFLPCSILIVKKNNEVYVGVSDPSLLGKLTNNPVAIEISSKANKILKELVNQAANVGPLKVKQVKLYATMSCPYCKMEASWLEENKIKFDHILVDLNPKAAEEMVRKTGQMGVPVTEIVYSNDEEEHIIGFDKARLTEILLSN